MVIRILTGKDVAGAVRYNEQKVEQGQADRIHIANYPDAKMASNHAQFRLQLLEQYTRLNPAIQKPSVHLAIAFHLSESITGDQLRAIGNEVMTDVGYGKQPYLMYQHYDTQHPHIHIVTVAVDGRGNRISDKFVKNRLQQVRRRLETKYGLVRAEGPPLSEGLNRVGEGLSAGQTTRQTVSDQLKRTLETHSFGSVESFQQYLNGEGIRMNAKAGRSQLGITYQRTEGKGANSRPIKASSLSGRPTHTRLVELFTSQGDRHIKGCEALAALLKKRLAAYRSLTETDYKQALRQLGIEVLETAGSYLYIQKRTGIVAQEVELGKSYSRQGLMERFSKKTERISAVTIQSQNQDSDKANGKKATPDGKQILTISGKRVSEKVGLSMVTRSVNVPAEEGIAKPTKNTEVPESTISLSEQPTKKKQTQSPLKRKQKKNRPNQIRQR